MSGFGEALKSGWSKADTKTRIDVVLICIGTVLMMAAIVAEFGFIGGIFVLGYLMYRLGQ